MGYDIYVMMKNRKNKTSEKVVLRSKHDLAGGTYCLGGTEEAWLSITFNYAMFYYKIWPNKKLKGEEITPFSEIFNRGGGIRSLYGKKMDTIINELTKAIDSFGDVEPSENYWEATPGNAKLALQKLLTLCEIAKMENPKAELTLEGN